MRTLILFLLFTLSAYPQGNNGQGGQNGNGGNGNHYGWDKDKDNDDEDEDEDNGGSDDGDLPGLPINQWIVPLSVLALGYGYYLIQSRKLNKA